MRTLCSNVMVYNCLARENELSLPVRVNKGDDEMEEV
jgi:hypothetical protein